MTEPRLPLDIPDERNDGASTVNASRPCSATRNPIRRLWRQRWGRILGITAAAFVAIIAGIMFLPKPGTTEQPVSWERNSDGTFTPSGQPAVSPALQFNAASLKARNSASKAGSSVHSGADFFASDSITVLNLSDSLLMKRAGDQLVETLKERGGFATVHHFPAGHQPEPGQRSDLFLTLDLKRVSVSGLASRNLEAEVHAQLGPSPVTSRHSYSSGLSPPSLSFHAHIEIDHQSTLTGVESSGARFQLQGASIAEALADQVLPEIEDRRSEEERMPDLPSGFFPDWTPAPQFEFLTTISARPWLSFAGCCLENETLWRVSDISDSASLMDAIHAELTADKWQGQRDTAEPNYLRLARSTESLEVFALRDGAFAADTSPREFWVRYRKVLGQPERQTLFEQLLTEQPPRLNLLLSLERMANRDQRERVLDLAQEHPPSTAHAWLNLAGRYFHRKQTEKAITAIQCAHLLGEIRHDNFSGQIRSLLKKHELDRSDTLVITREALHQIGAIDVRQLAAAPDGLTRPVSSGSLVAVYEEREPAEQSRRRVDPFVVAGVYFTPVADDTNRTLKVTIFELNHGSSSWTSDAALEGRAWQTALRNLTPTVQFQISKEDPTRVSLTAVPES